jgi:5-methylcytosine-specific restriction endonuclease McrA
VRVCAQPGCPALVDRGHSRCPEHEPFRGTTSERGYGGDHQRRRDILLPAAYGALCPLCGEVMLPGQALALDHTVPLAEDRSSVGDRIVHASCNSRAGQKISGRI